MNQKLSLMVLSFLNECVHCVNLDFLTKSSPDEEEAESFELIGDGDDDGDVGEARQLLNVVTIAAFNSTLLQLGRGTVHSV